MAPAMLRPGDERDLPVAKFEVENEEVFHMKNLYKRVHEWLVDEGFVSTDVGDDKIEIMYWERFKPDGISFEHHIWWRAVNTPKNNSYYRYFLKINYQTLNMKKTEVMSRGQKFNTYKGDVIFRIESWLQLDYKDEWGKKGFTKLFNNWLIKWFSKRLYKEEIDNYKQDLYRLSYRLNSAIKQYLMLKMVDDYNWGKPFHPERGV
jgi:hypothetical protein